MNKPAPRLYKEISAEELFQKLNPISSEVSVCLYDMKKCIEMTPIINQINRLKIEQNTIILAHSYVSAEIIYGIADFVGDSYGLSKNAMEVDCDTIIFAAVRFMGETAKILNPSKEVLIPGKESGCSLADAITANDVRKLKEQYPEHTIICYINTTADVKAECDVCVTSSNVYKIVEEHPNDKIIFVPDKLMGLNLQDEMMRRGVNKEIILFEGSCYVHEQYDPEMIEYLRNKHPGLVVVSHPECSPGIAMNSDYVGSTEQMIHFVKDSSAKDFLLLTECGLSGRMQAEVPDRNYIGSCNMCKYMKSNTLENILQVLTEPREEQRVILSDKEVSQARHCIDKMFEYAEK
jgi:quinolinate synthase